MNGKVPSVLVAVLSFATGAALYFALGRFGVPPVRRAIVLATALVALLFVGALVRARP